MTRGLRQLAKTPQSVKTQQTGLHGSIFRCNRPPGELAYPSSYGYQETSCGRTRDQMMGLMSSSILASGDIDYSYRLEGAGSCANLLPWSSTIPVYCTKGSVRHVFLILTNNKCATFVFQ